MSTDLLLDQSISVTGLISVLQWTGVMETNLSHFAHGFSSKPFYTWFFVLASNALGVGFILEHPVA